MSREWATSAPTSSVSSPPRSTKGNSEGSSSRLPTPAFLMVGLTYLVVASPVPGVTIPRAATWSLFGDNPNGMLFTFAAGVVGPVGALGIVLALVDGGRPNVVPPPDFAGAPVVSVFVAMLYNQPQKSPSPLLRPQDSSEFCGTTVTGDWL